MSEVTMNGDHDPRQTPTDPAPAPDVLFEMIQAIGSKVEIIRQEWEERKLRDDRVATQVQEIHAELVRRSKGEAT